MTGVTHIVLAMKPLQGNFAENALKYGVSGLNIDGCRVESELQENRERHGGGSSDIFPEQGNKPIYPSGRFPANVILGHSEGCKCVGTKKVKSTANTKRSRDKSSNPYHLTTECFDNNKPVAPSGYAGSDGKEEIEAWECVEGCPIKTIDGQSGVTVSTGGQKSLGAFRNGDIYGKGKDVREKGNPGFGDIGGASRFFKQVKEFQE